MVDIQQALHKTLQHGGKDQSPIRCGGIAKQAVVSDLTPPNGHDDHIQRGVGDALIELELHAAFDAVVHRQHLRHLWFITMKQRLPLAPFP